jgi:hypothetical protein
MDHCKSLRPIVRPNRGFTGVLLDLELQLFGENSITESELFPVGEIFLG